MGTRAGPLYVLDWQGTLAAMKAQGTVVQLASCECSRRRSEVDLGDLIATLGEDADLWDRRVTCKRCGKARHYLATCGEGTPSSPLITHGREVCWPPDVAKARARRAFVKSMGLTRRDVARIKALAESVTDNYTPAGLQDLDVPYRIQALRPVEANRGSGEPMGSWAGRMLVYWPLLGAARDAWARRPKGPRGVSTRARPRS